MSKAGENEQSKKEGALNQKKDEETSMEGTTKVQLKSDKSDFTTEELREVTATDSSPPTFRKSLVSVFPEDDDVREYDVDILDDWSQSSGTVSYNSAFSIHSRLENELQGAVELERQIIPPKLVVEKQHVMGDSVPVILKVTPKALNALNKTRRIKYANACTQTRIVVQDEKGNEKERQELIIKILDDALEGYFASAGKIRRSLKLSLECGGELPPRAFVKGILNDQKELRFNEFLMKRQIADETVDAKADEAAQVISDRHISGHAVRHMSTCSPALPYPSAPSFSRCSLSEHIRRVRNPEPNSFFGSRRPSQRNSL